MAGSKGKRLARWRDRPSTDVVDLRTDEAIDIRSGSTEYHCMRVWHNIAPARDPAADAWQRAAELVDFPSYLADLSSDRWRESLEPGPPSPVVLEAAAAIEVDEPAAPAEPI